MIFHSYVNVYQRVTYLHLLDPEDLPLICADSLKRRRAFHKPRWAGNNCIPTDPGLSSGTSTARFRITPKKNKMKPTNPNAHTYVNGTVSKHMVMQWRTIPFCNSLFEQSCTCFPCYQSAVWSGKCRVWSVECEVRSVECRVWSVECEVRSVECKVWSVKWGV